MPTQTDLIRINEAYHAGPAAVAEALAACGNPSAQALVDTALVGMQSPDRNVRVAMLWTLGRHPVDDAATGILDGLADAERRVREVAMKNARPFLADPRVAGALAVIATTPGEKAKLRSLALDALTGQVGGQASGPLPPAAIAALAPLLREDAFRAEVLMRLVRAELTPEVRAVLEEVARTGAAAEASLAHRALGGEVVINLGSVDDATRAAIAASGEPAYGRVFYWIYWIPREQTLTQPA